LTGPLQAVQRSSGLPLWRGILGMLSPSDER
jgi:hypothetical protein